jgi:hypothetical protein
MDPSEKYERARAELIERELNNVEEHLRDAAVRLGHDNLPMAKEFLERAKHSYELAKFHLEKLSDEQASPHDRARTLHKNLAELERQIERNSGTL